MLSEDEREAIERLKAQLNFWKKQNIKNSDCEIILNLITKLQKENVEKDKEIEKLKADNKKAWKLNANMSKRHLNDIFKIKNYEKQIDLMAEYISKHDIDEDICKEQADNNCDDINREAECKDCIKQYFEKSAKEEGE